MSCLVSVIVPAYNSAATLASAVASVLHQDVTDLEVIIVDDGSHDATAEVAGRLAAAEPRIRLIAIGSNHGKPHAMNVGIAEARGRWIAVLDADDWFAPNRLCRLLSAAEREGADLIADNQFLFDDGAGRVVGTAFAAQQGDRLLSKSAFAAGCDPYAKFDFGMLKPVARSDFIRTKGLRYHESARLSEDSLYMVEFLAAGGRAYLIGQPLYYWRQAFGSISRRWTETGAGQWRYNFESAAIATGEVLQSLRQAGEPELTALLERRMRAFRRLHVMQNINRLRADGAAPPALLRAVLAHPTIWSLLLRQIARRLWQPRTDLRQGGAWTAGLPRV